MLAKTFHLAIERYFRFAFSVQFQIRRFIFSNSLVELGLYIHFFVIETHLKFGGGKETAMKRWTWRWQQQLKHVFSRRHFTFFKIQMEISHFFKWNKHVNSSSFGEEIARQRNKKSFYMIKYVHVLFNFGNKLKRE